MSGGEVELKPCPFCGGDAKVVVEEIFGLEGGSQLFGHIECVSCGAEAGHAVDDEIANIHVVWNKRTKRENKFREGALVRYKGMLYRVVRVPDNYGVGGYDLKYRDSSWTIHYNISESLLNIGE